MEDLKNKDKTIKDIWQEVQTVFGKDYFSIVDFWESDNFALGFKRDDKLVYVSTWHFRDSDGLNCFAEFELIDAQTDETRETFKTIEKITTSNLVDEIKSFIG